MGEERLYREAGKDVGVGHQKNHQGICTWK
jgi:hypothetical protein